MKLSTILLPLAALAVTPAAAMAQDDGEEAIASSEEVTTRDYIAFANRGGVRDWHDGGRDVVYFQDRRKQWYRAELMGSSHDLPWVHAIGIDAGPSDRLDKWSAIVVRGQRFQLKSFEAVPGDKPWKAAEAEEADG